MTARKICGAGPPPAILLGQAGHLQEACATRLGMRAICY